MTIISFQHQFIFIKTVKTAGTSIEVDLSRHVEPGAVVTPIIPAEAGHEPRNYLSEDGQPRFYNHISAHAVRSALGREKFERMFVFAVEREPVDKCLSHFHMLKNRDDAHGLPADQREALNWENYVDEGNFPIDLNKYRDPHYSDMRMMLNRILAYEKLGETLPVLLAGLGIHDFKFAARAKTEYRRKVYLEAKDVTPHQKQRIYKAFYDTIRITGLYGD